MSLAFDAVSIVLGLVLGAAIVWLVLRAVGGRAAGRLEDAERQQDQLRQERDQRDAAIADLREEVLRERDARARAETERDAERKAAAEKLAVLDRAREQLQDAFKALSAQALESNNQSFLTLAKATLETFQEGARADLEQRRKAVGELVAPVRQSLDKMDGQIQELEKARAGAYEGLRQQVRSLVDSQERLRGETATLVRALRTPNVRGRWGEIQLKRVVELAGMVDHCDFLEQPSVEGDAGRLRPDMIVRLPGDKTIVVDAKTPIDGFLASVDASDDTDRLAALARHARHVRDHMRALGQKQYWSQFEDAPEFVVLFLPGENFFSAALEQDPALIEAGIDQSVIPATPTTLIALLRAVAYGWRQERLADNARRISQLGRELFDRLASMGGSMDRLGRQLGSAVDSYNKAVGSLESRVLVSARKLKELDAASDTTDLTELTPLDHAPRELQAPELRALPPRDTG